MENWPEYSKYMVLADNANGKIRQTYEAFLNYTKILDVLHSMSYTDKNTYSYNNNIYKKKITSEDARKILENIRVCRWTQTTAKIKLIASQLELRI